jgi:hypothetical protein
MTLADNHGNLRRDNLQNLIIIKMTSFNQATLIGLLILK